MNKDYFIRLAFAVYRVTELFPENEPLKLRVRESANKILADLILIFTENPVTSFKEKSILVDRVLKEIGLIEQYFNQSQEKNWVRPVNFLILRKEYDKIKKSVIEYNQARKDKKKTEVEISPRKKKILEILRKKGKLRVAELQGFFPGISKRTLRRDLENLLRRKLIKRVGEWSQVFYKVTEKEKEV